MIDINRYRELASKWLNGSITQAEKEEFLAWYNAHEDEKVSVASSFAKDEMELKQRILSKVNASMYPKPKIGKIRSLLRKGGMAAASVILLGVLGIGYYHFIARDSAVAHVGLDGVKPGTSKALLSLDGGQVIDLHANGQGLVIGDEFHYMDGSLLESDALSDLERETSFVTLSTPKGGEYRLKLSDGTQVWLNAKSAIRFPRKFNKNRREVELLEGEAFFDVTSKTVAGTKIPFFVKNHEQMVEVLGTQFNINAYDKNRGIVTTVAEGSVAVKSSSHNHNRMILAVGMQTVVNKDGIRKYQVDIEEFMAWKDGYFYFNDADIYTVLTAFERWYDIEVAYDIKRSDDLFYGKLPKNVTLDKALHVLKTAGVHFELKNGRELTIKNK